jgi:hypothetical protein
MRFVGIDPGQTGACVVVDDDGCTVLDVQRWSKQRTPPLLTVVEEGDVVALEAQHVARHQASLVLAEWSGRMIATLPWVVLLRPLATSWRAKVLRGGRLQRHPAKQLAIAAASPYVPGTVTHDVAEAWCLARYAWGWAMAHPAELLAVQP